MFLLENARIVDGTGRAPFTGNVLILGPDIAAVGDAPAPEGSERIDCTNLTVAPGFIDLHSHSDLQVLENERAKADQGVTTEVVGNCGFSAFPCDRHAPEIREFANGIFRGQGDWGWPGARLYLTDAAARANCHVVSLVGHGTLRIARMGPRQGPPEPRELDAMEQTLAEALAEGAAGLSTGLMYAPGSSAPRDELVRLCRVVARHGKLYATHMRSYSSGLLEAIEEQLDLARATGCRLQISHLQAVGRANWDQQHRALERIEQARAEGLDVEFDIYPYTAGSTVATQLLPQWALDGGTAALLARLADRDLRRRIRRETVDQLAQTWSDIYVSAVASPENAPLVGRDFAAIAAHRGVEPPDALLDLLIEERGRVTMLSFNQSEDNLRQLLTHPLCTVISDGFYVRGRPHPRLYGTFPRLLGEICRDRGWMSLAEAVHKITAKPAARLGLVRRGRLAPGHVADVTVFDASTISGRATYEAPEAAPAGLRMVFRQGRRISLAR